MLPQYHSLAFADMPNPDYADMIILGMPVGATSDPAIWARTFFSVESAPAWVRAAMAARQVLAPLIGVPKAPRDVFTVDRVEGEEALISVNDRHLNFRCAVGVDEESHLVRVTTAVTLNGWRGRLYFAPVRLAHPIVVFSMLRRAVRVLGRAEPRLRSA